MLSYTTGWGNISVKIDEEEIFITPRTIEGAQFNEPGKLNEGKRG